MVPLPGVLGAAAMMLAPSVGGSGYAYRSSVGFNMSFFDEAIDAGILPEDIPLFGKDAVGLQFIPKMSCEIGSDGVDFVEPAF